MGGLANSYRISNELHGTAIKNLKFDVQGLLKNDIKMDKALKDVIKLSSDDHVYLQDVNVTLSSEVVA